MIVCLFSDAESGKVRRQELELSTVAGLVGRQIKTQDQLNGRILVITWTINVSGLYQINLL